MKLTPREQELLNLIRQFPLSSPEELARRLGSTRTSVNVHVGNLIRKGALLGRGYLLPGPHETQVVVVGGANMDVKCRTLRAAIPATSNPGQTAQAAGGVGRNIAENLARLGLHTSLISAVGRDLLGDTLLHDAEAAGVNVSGMLRSTNAPTSTYTAVLDASGELLIAVAAMQVMDDLTPAALLERRTLLARADWVVADGNLRPDTLTQLLTLTAKSSAKVVFEPVSVPKAAHLLPALQTVLAPYAVTPNLDELATLTGTHVPNQNQAIRQAALHLHEQGIEVVWVRRGKQGSVLSTPHEMHEFPALPAQVEDVTGAGDAMLAAFIAALSQERTLPEAVQFAHAAAALTIESQFTVVPDLTFEKVKQRLDAHAEERHPATSI